MRTLLLVAVLLLATACDQRASGPAAGDPSTEVPEAQTTTYVKAAPLSAGRILVSITAPGRSLYIVNCNEHIVTALLQEGSTVPVWGGASDACLSASIIIPAGATLSYVVDVSTGTEVPLGPDTYRIQVFNMLTGLDLKSPPVASALVTSNRFTLQPRAATQ